MSPVFFFAHRKKYPFYHFPPFAFFKRDENTGQIIVVVINDRLGLKMKSVEWHWLYLYILLYKFFMVHQCRFGGLLGQICDSEYGAGAQSTAHPHHVYEIPPNPPYLGSAPTAPRLAGDRMGGAL